MLNRSLATFALASLIVALTGCNMVQKGETVTK